MSARGRCVTLLLFVYANGTETLFRVVEDGLIPTLVCLLLYVCMHKYNFEMKKHPSLAFLTRALNMVSINFILRSLSSLCRESASLPVQTALYTVVLFLVDTVCALNFTSTVVCLRRHLSAAPSNTCTNTRAGEPCLLHLRRNPRLRDVEGLTTTIQDVSRVGHRHRTIDGGKYHRAGDARLVVR